MSNMEAVPGVLYRQQVAVKMKQPLCYLSQSLKPPPTLNLT